MDYREIYKEAADGLQPSSELMDQIRSSREVRMIMNKKKMVALAFVACMMIGTTAFAASRIAGFTGLSTPNTETTDYQETVKTAERLETARDVLSEFSNGYIFEKSNIRETAGVDEAGNTVAEGESLVVNYTKENCPTINLYIAPLFETEDYSDATESREINGVMVHYNKHIYKCVPDNYKLTEEDEKRMDEPHFYLSYGSSEVDEKVYEGIIFETDNKVYNMFCWDGNMTVDEWFAMAEELLQQ